MPSTIGHGLLPAACLLASKSRFSELSAMQFFKFSILVAILGNASDLDVIPAALYPSHWREIHREWGHNLFATGLWIYIGTRLIRRYISPEIGNAKAWITSGLCVVCHIFMDALGGLGEFGERMGCPLFWPFSDWDLIFPVVIFDSYRLEKGINPILAHLTSTTFWNNAIFYELFYAWFVGCSWYLTIRGYDFIKFLWLEIPQMRLISSIKGRAMERARSAPSARTPST